ncbi:MAG: sodium-dependent transporter [Bdellovibrionales bacterium]|nr:sodium-dependent transporter [Bdellovibrionales bacterium]
MKFKVWGARLGFFLALVASASGLGNLWRFPYVVAENGGGGFVILYLFLVLVVGLPLLIGELLVGRMTGKSILASLSHFKGAKIISHLGNLAMVLCLLVLGYFSLISSWVLFYFYKYSASFFTDSPFNPPEVLAQLTSNTWLQILLTAFHITLTVAVISKEIEDGLEKFVGYIMPFFAVLLCMMVWQSLSLDTAEEALRYLFYPNFSQLTWFSLSSALGQVLFTLSLGFTTMVTFGSLLPKDTNVPHAGIGIASIDSIISLLAGMLIFPLIIGAPISQSGPLILFEAVPEFLSSLIYGNLFGGFFFLFLYLGAFGASIGILETVVINLKECHCMDRTNATVMAGAMCFIISIFPALATSKLSEIEVFDVKLIVLWDHFLVNGILPLIALLIGLWIYFAIPLESKKAIFNKQDVIKDEHMFNHWHLMLKWVVPIVTLLAFTLSLIGFLKN